MRTPQQWLESVDFDWDEQVSVRMIEAIQQDAFESGRVYGLKLAAHQDRCNVYTDRNRDLLEQCAKEHELAAATPNPLKSPSL